MFSFSKCLNCDKVHNDRPRTSNNTRYCSTCIPLSKEEVAQRSAEYLPVSKGYISYDDTLPVYWGD